MVPLVILERLRMVPVQVWNYKDAPGVPHIGPMAQNFASAFNVGETPTRIHPVDGLGVALAAIQGLHQLVLQQQEELKALRREVAGLRTSGVASSTIGGSQVATSSLASCIESAV